jgi:mRNA interferase MazF
MRRGNIWVASGGPHYASEPRPFVVVRDDAFDSMDSITICPFTTEALDIPLFRLVVEPNELNGLRATNFIMVDKVTSIPKTKLGKRIGRLDDQVILRLNAALIVFLGLAGSPRMASPGTSAQRI